MNGLMCRGIAGSVKELFKYRGINGRVKEWFNG